MSPTPEKGVSSPSSPTSPTAMTFGHAAGNTVVSGPKLPAAATNTRHLDVAL